MGLLAILASLSIATLPPSMVSPSPEPDVNLSGIRLITCDEGSGTGFVVGENVLATALHVADLTNCQDAQTKKPLTMYHSEPEDDFALMRGEYPKLLALRWACEGYKTGQGYDSYGISSFAVGQSIFRQYKAVSTGRYTNNSFIVGKMKGGERPMPGMHELRGWVVPGNSGGPVTRQRDGRVIGINNVGVSSFFGYLQHNDLYSYELKNTVLCKRPTT